MLSILDVKLEEDTPDEIVFVVIKFKPPAGKLPKAVHLKLNYYYI